METGQFFRAKKLQKNPCKHCGQPIKPGQYFAWNRTNGAFSAGWHWDCAQADVNPPEDKIYRRNREAIPQVTPEVKLPTCAKCGQQFTSERDEVTHQCARRVDTASAPVTLPESAAVVPETSKPASASNDPMRVLADAIAPHLHLNTADILAKVDAQIKDSAREIAKELQAALTVRVEIVNRGEVKQIDGVHENFPQLLKLVNCRMWAFLHGPAGSMKSTHARKAAEAIGLGFESISLNVQTFESRLFGFIDANSHYNETGFRRCYENGGVFLIDEIDNASGNLLTALNTALANGHAPFPDRMVDKHADFVCIATGNTAGRGASRNHSDRRALDAATLDRFVHLAWGYDWKLVRAATLAINENAGKWSDWIRQVCDYCAKEFPQVLATPRACFNGAELLRDALFTVGQIAGMTVFKGLDRDSVSRILTANPLPEIAAN